jgi:hypothetical protein
MVMEEPIAPEVADRELICGTFASVPPVRVEPDFTGLNDGFVKNCVFHVVVLAESV